LFSFTVLIWKDETDLIYPNFMPILSFFLTYPAVMVYAATTVSLVPLDNRYVSPVYVPLVLLLCAGIHHTRIESPIDRMRGPLGSFFIAALILMVVASLSEGIRNPTEGKGDPGTVFIRKFDTPDSTQVYVDSGLALAEQGRDFEAFLWYTRALELSPDSYDIHNRLGLVLVELGARDRALRHFNRALEIDPDRAEAYTNTGLFLLKEGRLEEAVEFFSVVIGKQPDHVEAYTNLGSIREAQGNTQEAIRVYRQALEQRPDYEPARQSLNRLLGSDR
jgi:tetratricopeptide (TPR) repeat protein